MSAHAPIRMPSLRTLYRLTKNLPEVLSAVRGMRGQRILPAAEHLRLCADWLLTAQSNSPDDGYSRLYSLTRGWDAGYIECSGYIVQTMLDAAALLGDSRYRESALRAGEWLLSVQQRDGSFTDIDERNPQVFDTGQVLLGLNRLYRETSDGRYFDAAIKAGDWLLDVQDADGSWATAGYYRGRASTYHTRVGAALIELTEVSGDRRYSAAGASNLDWALTRQTENGSFLDCELVRGQVPILHTIVYVLEGLMMAYRLTGERRWLSALLKTAGALKEINVRRDIVLTCRYDAEFEPAGSEKCLTGLAQWAGLCLDIYGVTGDKEYFELAALTIYYLKSKQLHREGALKGALPGSIPLWGEYNPFTFVNWGVKFFADALVKYVPHELSVWREQELWVTACLRRQLDGGAWEAASWKFEPMDELVAGLVDEALDGLKREKIVLMDLGCGTGKYVRHFRDRYPDFEVVGVDPCYSDGALGTKAGSAYDIPSPDASVDVLFTYIVLQHVSDIGRALSEIRRVLKPGGLLIIGDRNPISGRGLLKPYHELSGKWAYPWDSPFLERWYTRRQWADMLGAAGFDVERAHGLDNPGEVSLRSPVPMNRFHLIYARRRA